LQRATKKTIHEILGDATFILSFMRLFFSEFAVDNDGSNRCYAKERIDSALIFNDLGGRAAQRCNSLIFNALSIQLHGQEKAHPEGWAKSQGIIRAIVGSFKISRMFARAS
jgi:hypothetical protein